MSGSKVDPAVFQRDTAFDKIYPQHIRDLSQRHWTPVNIARKAGSYLGVPGSRVLDMGSGVGKFCLTAGFFYPDAIFCGIEQRSELFDLAEATRKTLNLNNVSFIYGDLADVDLDQYDHFYFYNSFYEHIEPHDHIDSSVPVSVELYNNYSDLLYKMLATRPADTRLVTFHGTDDQVPSSYYMVNNSYHPLLKMWIRE